MPDKPEPSPPPGGQFLIYQTADGKLKLDVRFEGETVWLTQQHMAALFQTSVPNISMHIRNVFAEGELPAGSVVKESLTTAADGKNYAVKFYPRPGVGRSATGRRRVPEMWPDSLRVREEAQGEGEAG